MMKPYKRSKYFLMVTPPSVSKGPRDITSSFAGQTLIRSEDSYLLSPCYEDRPRDWAARLNLVDYGTAISPPPFHSIFAHIFYFMHPTRCLFETSVS